MPIRAAAAVRACLVAGAACSLSLLALAHPGGEEPGGGGNPSDEDQFPGRHVGLLAWMPLHEFGSRDTGTDCWGYTSPSGREYALMGFNDTTAFVDITDPSEPEVVRQFAHVDSPWSDIKTHSHHAYVVNESGGGLQVFDLTGIDNGMIAQRDAVEDQGLETAHNVITNEDSDYIYVCGQNIAGGGLMALDVSDPGDPQIAGAYTDTYVHDAQVVTYDSGPYAGREIAFCYGGQSGLDIVDVTDKGQMTRMSRLEYEGLGYTHQGWLAEDGVTLYLDDETDELNGLVDESTTRVIDVSDLSNPTVMSTFTTRLSAIDHNLYIRGQTAFLANYESGLRIFDLSVSPTDPLETGWFDTFPERDDLAFNGVWSVYPFFESGTVIISDINRGLFVVETARADGTRIHDLPPAAFDVRPIDADNRGIDETEDLTLKWDPAIGTARYEVTVATDQAMTDVVHDAIVQEPETTIEAGTLASCEAYHWTVTAMNHGGFTQQDSGVATFSTASPFDLTGEGLVDAGDLAVLIGEWGGGGSADFDGDGTVGAADLGILISGWGACGG